MRLFIISRVSDLVFLHLFSSQFARLLFDRMLESFRRSAEVALVGSLEQNEGLGDLLPSIFGGTTMYVTECSGCRSTSERREDFMEVTIPIVDCEEEEESLPGRKQSGKTKEGNDKSSAKSGIDIQLCVNSYLHPESLKETPDDDNRYECSL
jgi:hypothetical protein